MNIKILFKFLVFTVFLTAGCGTFEMDIEQPASSMSLPTAMALDLTSPSESPGTTIHKVTETPTSVPTLTPTPAPGLRVAFIADGQVWLWREGEKALPIASVGERSGIPDVKLSDDGALVAFLRGR